MSRTCAMLLSAAVVAYVAPVAAAPRATTRLSYVRDVSAASCPDESALRQEIAQRLGYDPVAPAAPGRVSAVVTSSAGTFRAIVQHDDDGTVRGTRELDATACTELVASIALTIVILLDPPPPGTYEAAPEPELPLVLSTPDRAPAAAPRASSARVALRIGAGALGAAGVLPGPAVGFDAFGGAQLAAWSADVEARVLLPASSDGARASLVLGAFVPCFHAGVAVLCATTSFGMLRGEGLEAGEPKRATTLYAAVGPRAGIEVPLERDIAVHAHLQADIPLTPTTLRQGGVELWTTPFVGGGASFGVTARFL